MTLARAPLVVIGCLASIAVVPGCGSTSSASDTASDSGTTDSSTGSTGTTGTTTTTSPTSGTTADTTTTDSTTTTGTPTTSTTTDTTGTTTSSTTAVETTADTTTTIGTSTTDTSGAQVSCGNGVVEFGEECDDGNRVDGDGCDSSCTFTVLCGNGVLDPGEACDDGNLEPDDGCGPACATECGFLCIAVGEPCIPGFHAVQCASPGEPLGQPSAIANTCQLATLSVDGSHIALSPETTMGGAPRHLDAMYTDPSNAVFGFAGDTENIAAGSQLVAVNTETGELTPIGPSLGMWVMGAAMNDDGELWTTVFDTYERNETTEVHIARISAVTGEIVDGPTLLTEGGMPVTVWSTHVSDVAFRYDGAMFVSANEPGPPPPEPLSRYLEVDRASATVVSAVAGPNDLYAAGLVFVGEEQQVIAMDIRGVDDIFVLDLAAPPSLNATLLYPDPIMTNSGTADLAGCSKLVPQ